MSASFEKLKRDYGANVMESITSGVGPAPPPPPSDPQGRRVGRDPDAQVVPMALLDRDPDQPRQDFAEESLGELAGSIAKHGLLQPCLAIREPSGRYTLLDGERRWRACTRLEWVELPCRVVARENVREAGLVLARQLAANHHRDALKPMELARALARLRDVCGWTQARIAAEVHVSQATVSDALKLVDMPAEVRDLVESDRLSATTAREIGRLKDPEAQVRLARRAVEGHLTRDETQAIVAGNRGLSPGDNPAAGLANPSNPSNPPAATGLRESPAPARPLLPGNQGLSPGDNCEPGAGEELRGATGETAAAPESPALVAPAAAKPGAASVSRPVDATFLGDVGGAYGKHSYRLVEFEDCVVEARWKLGGPNDLHRFRDALMTALGMLNGAIADQEYARLKAKDSRPGKDRRRP